MLQRHELLDRMIRHVRAVAPKCPECGSESKDSGSFSGSPIAALRQNINIQEKLRNNEMIYVQFYACQNPKCKNRWEVIE